MKTVISIFSQDAASILLEFTLVALSLWAIPKIVNIYYKSPHSFFGAPSPHPKVSSSEKSIQVHKDRNVPNTSAWASMGEVTPLKDFDYRKVEPQRMYKFNPKYFLTMGLQKTDINGIIHIDRLYASRMEARQELIREWPGSLACLPPGAATVTEFYEFLTQHFLPTRYPTIFRLDPPPTATLSNLVTGDRVPLTAPRDPIDALRIINRNVEEDFLMMLPAPDGSDSYTLQAFIFAYPVGFDPQSKLGLSLRQVHQPVPHFNEKLALSLDRYFRKLEPGNVKWRNNWALATSDKLCVRGEYHLYPGQEPTETEFEIEECRVRAEQQTLFALPKTGARILSVHLYLYALQELKDLGVGPEMITAIDGLDGGNAPGVHRYKRAVVWGEKVKDFLRS